MFASTVHSVFRLYLKLVFVKDDVDSLSGGASAIPASPTFPPYSSKFPEPSSPPPGYLRPSSPDGPPPSGRETLILSSARVAKRPLSYESDDDVAPLHTMVSSKKIKLNPYESDSDNECETNDLTGAVCAPTFGSRYGSDSEDENEPNPFSSTNPIKASSATHIGAADAQRSGSGGGIETCGTGVGSGGFSHKYGSDDEDEAVQPALPPPITAGSNRFSNQYGSSPEVDRLNHEEDKDDDDDDNDDDGEVDPATQRLLRIRDLAMELCGGLDEWDALGDEQMEHFLEIAREKIGNN